METVPRDTPRGASRAVSARRRRARRARLIALALAFVVLLLGLGLFPQEELRRRVETRLRAALGPRAHVGRLHVVPFLLRVEAWDVRLADGTFDAELPRVLARLAPESLLGRGLVVARLEVERPRLTLRPAAAPVAPTAAWSGPLRVAALRVSSGRVAYDGGARGRVEIEDLQAVGTVGHGQLDVTAGPARVSHPTFVRPLALRGARLALRVTPELELHVARLAVESGTSRLEAAGALGRAGAWRPALDVTGHVHLADMARVAGDAALGGGIDLKGRVDGTPTALHVTLRAASEAAEVAGWPLQNTELRLTHDGAGQGQTEVQVATTLLGGRVQAQASLTGGALDGRASLAGLDVRSLARRLAPTTRVQNGRLAGELRAHGPLGTALSVEARTTAQAHVTGTDLTLRGEARGTFDVQATHARFAWTLDGSAAGAPGTALRDAELRAAGQATVARATRVDGRVGGRVRLAGAPDADGAPHPIDVAFAGPLRVDGTRTTAHLDAQALDGRWSADVTTHGMRIDALHVRGDDLRLERALPGVTGGASLELRVAGPVAALDGSGHAQTSDVTWNDVALGALRADLRLDRGRVHLEAEAPRLRASAAATLADGVLRGQATLAGTPLEPFALLAAQPVAGTLSARADVELPLDAPRQARLDAHVSALELSRDAWSARAVHAFDVRYEGGRTHLRDLALEGAGARLDVDADLDASGEAHDVRARLTADLAHLPLPEGAHVEGTLRADVHATGRAAHPRAEGWLEVQGAGATWPGLPALRLDDARLALQGTAAALHGVRVHAAGGTLDVSGRVPWAALTPAVREDATNLADDEQAELTLAWQGLDGARLLEALAPARAADVRATLAGHAELRGGLRAPGELSGTVTLPETTLVVADVPLTLATATLHLAHGRVQTDGLRLEGRDAVLNVSGAVDLRRQALDVRGRGGFDLRLLSPFLGEAALLGRADLDAEIAGTLARPQMLGTLVLKDGTLRLRELRQPLTQIGAWLTLDGERLELRELSARLGGGALAGSGKARLTETGLADVAVRLTGEDVGLRYPAGLRSRLDADLRLTGRTGALLLGGQATLKRGFYDLDVVAEQSLFAAAVRPEPSPLLRSVALDVAVDLSQPVVVRNNLADVRVGGRLHARGDLETPAPFGRLDVVPGGTARLGANDFIVERGSLSYAGTWNAAVDLNAASAKRIGDRKDAYRTADARAKAATESYDVTVAASGTLDEPRLTLQSTPPLDERQLMSLLLTGRSDADIARQGGLAAGEQTAALLTGRLARGLSEGLQPLGIDQVTIEPQLVARDTDPGARFTFGKHLAPRAFLVYSTSLRSAEDRFVRLDLGPFHTLRVAGQRDTDGERGFDLGQRLQWGGGGPRREPAPQRLDERVTLAGVRFEGDAPLPAAELSAALDVRAGQRHTRWDLIDRAEHLRGRLVREGFLEAEVGTRLDAATAVVHVRSGPRYDWRVEGLRTAPDLRAAVQASLFEEEALQNGRARLLRALHGHGHLRAEVRTRVEARPERRTLVFEVEPGPRLALEAVRFPGAHALSRGELLRLAGGPAGVLVDPRAAARAWTDAYHARHFFAAQVETPRVEERAGRVVIEARIDEGPPARVAALRLEGTTLDAPELERAAGLAPGTPYSDDVALEAARRLRDHYLGLGYPDARVVPEAEPSGADVTVVLRVSEGQPSRIVEVAIDGAHLTRAALLRARAGLEPGAPLDPRALGAAEGRLRALGTLGAARVTSVPGAPGRLQLEIEELPRFALGYDYRYDDERGSSAQIDGEVRHLFGRALVLGGRYRTGRDEREARAFLNVPLRPGPLTFSLSRLAEDLPGIGDAVNHRVRREVRVQQVFERRPWLLLAGYRFRRLTLAPFRPEPLDIAALSASLVRDTRDNPLDTRSGRFYGVDVELSPAWLGADLRFVKGFGQAFFTRSRGPFTWAQGYRLGLAASLTGAPITASELFFAGGGNSVRGFATDSLGPLGVDDRPAGGAAVIVLNQELRWRHASGVGAVIFYDGGNVFARVSDVSFDLRHALGTGLRYASPLGLLRVDFGAPLARRAGERHWRLFFSIGQAF